MDEDGGECPMDWRGGEGRAGEGEAKGRGKGRGKRREKQRARESDKEALLGLSTFTPLVYT